MKQRKKDLRKAIRDTERMMLAARTAEEKQQYLDAINAMTLEYLG